MRRGKAPFAARFRAARRLLAFAGIVALACASPATPRGYRFAGAGAHWSDADGPGIDDLKQRYPVYFAAIVDPANTRDPRLRRLREDIERRPVDHFNYDALNAVAAGYFELCYRTGQLGSRDFADDARADRLLIVPWEAYGRIDDPGLRDAILDFFEDAGAGMKLGTAATAPRLAGIVASLETKETDPGRRARIQRLAGALSLERSPE